MASYQPVTKEIVEQLEKIAPGRVYFGDDVNPDYGRDEMPIYGIRMPEASVDALSTEAGIEDAARTQLGWVHEGEHAVSVSGLAEKDEASEFRGNIVSEDITAPDSWYSDLLDPIFGVE